MKKPIFTNTNPNIRLVFNFLLLLIFVFVSISISPSILGESQPDSNDFMTHSKTRNFIYLIFFRFSELFNFDLILFQKLLFSFSVVSIVYALRHIKINKFFCAVFLLAILLNFYLTSFSKIYLAESLFFSFINILIALLLINGTHKSLLYYFLTGLFVGLVFATKKVGPVIAISFIVFIAISILRMRKRKETLLFFGSIFFVVLIENLFFFSKFDERESVFTQSMMGKIFLISGKDSFIIDNYPIDLRDTLNLSKQKFSKIHEFLDKIANPFLKAELMADFEVSAQYQFLDENPESKKIKKKFIDNVNETYFELLKYNFSDYIKMSYFHYIGMWSAGHKFSLINHYELDKKELIFKEELLKSSGPVNIFNYTMLKYAQSLFILLFIIFIILTILSIFLLLSKRNNNRTLFIFFIFTSQLYLITISLVNVATLRYLMPVYSLIIVAIIIISNDFRNVFNEISKKN